MKVDRKQLIAAGIGAALAFMFRESLEKTPIIKDLPKLGED